MSKCPYCNREQKEIKIPFNKYKKLVIENLKLAAIIGADKRTLEMLHEYFMSDKYLEENGIKKPKER